MPIASGVIQFVQEQRFRLRTPSGASLLLTLAHDAPLDVEELHAFHQRGQRVTVRYEGEPNLASGTARDVYPS